MDDRMKWLLGAAAGAAGMYYFDPARGRYRRSLVRNRLVHAGHKARRAAAVAGRDLWNRAVGIGAELAGLLDGSRPDDAVLVERVRACLGRVVTHPSSVHVEAENGVVTLRGLILEKEVPALLDCVHSVHGVTAVRNELEAHAEPGRIPGLQGNPPARTGNRAAFMQKNWPPAARALGGIAGAAAMLYGLGRRDAGGTLVGAAGALLATRAATNMEIGRLLGVGRPRHAVEVHKSIRIHAPVERVFALWENFESFPKFMKHVRRVRQIRAGESERRWRWTVRGAGGLETEFDTVVTAHEPNRFIAWRTEGSSLVRHAGIVRFNANDDGSTTVDVKMVYNPVAGALGHAFAWLLGADPKHQMDDDFLRMKTFLETGRPPRDAAEPGASPDEILPPPQPEVWRQEAAEGAAAPPGAAAG